MVTETHKINFIGIGALKSATSWLFHCIEEHPDLLTAEKANNKEINFFNFNFYKGYQWYENLFEFDGRLAGEYSSLYFHNRMVPERIYDYNPDMKLILSLRNPVDRLISHHKHELRRGRLPKSHHNLVKAIESNPLYLSIGQYATHLERFLNFFPRKQILVIFLNDIREDPKRISRRLYKFMSVNPEYMPKKLKERRNVSHVPRSRTLQALRFKTSSWLRNNFGDWAIHFLKTTRLDQLLNNMNRAKITEESIYDPPENLLKYIRDLYLPEIEKLERILEMSLDHWK